MDVYVAIVVMLGALAYKALDMWGQSRRYKWEDVEVLRVQVESVRHDLEEMTDDIVSTQGTVSERLDKLEQDAEMQKLGVG